MISEKFKFKKMLGCCVALSLCLCFIQQTAFAASFDLSEIGVGARVLGMGKAFNSIADDGSAIFTNPAGLTNTKSFDFTSMGGTMVNEIPYTMAGGTYKTNYGVFGVGYVGAGVSGINEATLVGGTPEITGNTGSYSNTVLVLSYANNTKNIPSLNSIDYLKQYNTRIGANIKLISYGFTGSTSFDVSRGKASGFDMDAGALFDILPDLTGSLTLKDLIPGSNIGQEGIAWSIVGGLAYKLKQYNLLTDFDAELKHEGMLMRAGLEWAFYPNFAIRAGLDQKRDGTNMAMGLGAMYNGFTFDYAYHTYAQLGQFSSHFFSLGYVGEEPRKGKQEVIAPAIPIKSTTVEAKPQLQKPKDKIIPKTQTTTSKPEKQAKPTLPKAVAPVVPQAAPPVVPPAPPAKKVIQPKVIAPIRR